MKIFFGKYQLKKKKQFRYRGKIAGMLVQIHSNICLEQSEIDKVCNIILQNLSNENELVGDKIAEGIVKNMTNGICSAEVDGGKHGKSWTVNLSTEIEY